VLVEVTMATSKYNVINNTWHSGGEWGASEYYIYLGITPCVDVQSNCDRNRGTCSGFSVSPRRGYGKSSSILAGQQARRDSRASARQCTNTYDRSTIFFFWKEQSVHHPQLNVNRTLNRKIKRNWLTSKSIWCAR